MKRLLLASICTTFVACYNPEVPAGHEGYFYHKPLVFGQMEFRDARQGPYSPGLSWRLYTISINMQQQVYEEKFQLLTKDNLLVSFVANATITLRPGSVKEIVERWGGQDWYKENVKEPLRTAVRDVLARYDADKLQTQTSEIQKEISAKVLELTKTTLRLPDQGSVSPFVITGIDLDDIKRPAKIQDAIDKKQAAFEELKRQKFVLSETLKKGRLRVKDAVRITKKQLIISAELSPLYVQWKAVQVYKKLAQSDNKTVMVLPQSSEGTGVPLVMQNTRSKNFSGAQRDNISKLIDKRLEEWDKLADSKLMEDAANKLIEDAAKKKALTLPTKTGTPEPSTNPAAPTKPAPATP